MIYISHNLPYFSAPLNFLSNVLIPCNLSLSWRAPPGVLPGAGVLLGHSPLPQRLLLPALRPGSSICRRQEGRERELGGRSLPARPVSGRAAPLQESAGPRATGQLSPGSSLGLPPFMCCLRPVLPITLLSPLDLVLI